MKGFKEFIAEATPTNRANVAGAEGGFGSTATATGPVAGYDPKLFKDPVDDDLLSQDYQTPDQPGLAKWRFSTIWPVEHVTLANIEKMVAASNKYIDIMDTKTQQRIRRNMGSLYESRKNFNSFIEEAADKRCPKGHYWCYTDKKCKKIPSGYHVGLRGYLVHDKKENGNGSNNGNGNGNGNGGNGNGGNGHGNGGGNGNGNGG